MTNFHEIYDNLTESQKNFLNYVFDEANKLRNSKLSSDEILKEFADKVRTGHDWDAKNRTDDKALTEGNISNEYLRNFVYGLAGTILGIDPKFLIAGAAAQQQMKNNNDDYNGQGNSQINLGLGI